MGHAIVGEAVEMPFEQWMEEALFAPERGYYSAQVKTVGRNGDFSTAATLNDLLGTALAGWLQESRKEVRGVRAVIEVGGGDGSLMKTLRQKLGWLRGLGLRWHMVERSPVLRQKQRDRLGMAVAWHDTMEEALDACGGAAWIFHNELVDAFPVRCFSWEVETGWREMWVRSEGAGWREMFRPAAENLPPGFAVTAAWAHQGPPGKKPQRVELHAAYRRWLEGWAPKWRQGTMVTVDYGDVFPALYHRRPSGTLRAYWLHQRLTGEELLQQMGRRDVTADVNFSDLMAWGELLGWQTKRFCSQREFLSPYVAGAQGEGLSFVLDEAGAGEAFKVLVQERIG